MKFTTQHVKADGIGLLETELAKKAVPIIIFEYDANTDTVSFEVDDNATQQQFDWAQDLTDNMQGLTINLEDDIGDPIMTIPNDGITKLVVTCDELPTDFGYGITTQHYNNFIDEDVVDTDGILEITSNMVGLHYIRIFDLLDESRVAYAEFQVIPTNGG